MKIDKYKNLKIPSLTSVILSLFPKLQSKKTKKFKVVIFGFFGMRNIGDDAILLAEVNELSKLNVPLEIVVPSQNPKIVEATNNVKSIPNKKMLSTLSEIASSNLIIFGGGGLICKAKSNLSVKEKFFDIFFTVYKCLMYFFVPKLLGKKIIVFGIGAYPNINVLQRISYTLALNLADYISVRDKVSQNFLKNKLVIPVRYQKDVAFLLDDIIFGRDEMMKMDKIISRSSSKKNIGISLISANDMYIDSLIRNSVNKVLRRYKDKCNYYFFPFFTEPGHENDITIASKLKNVMSDVTFEIIPEDIGAQGFYYLYSKLDGALCMRFHSQIFAYKNGINFFGISYDEKCKSFLEEIRTEYVETSTFNSGQFEKRFDKYLRSLLKQ